MSSCHEWQVWLQGELQSGMKERMIPNTSEENLMEQCSSRYNCLVLVRAVHRDLAGGVLCEDTILKTLRLGLSQYDPRKRKDVRT